MKKPHKLWMLPDGVSELAPDHAHVLEKMRRKCIDLYAGWGYDLVYPPLIEFIESLLIGNSADLDLQTFKLTDQLSGKTMGLRADMTPQAARIDSHVRCKNEPDRLCYAGPVSRTRTTGVGLRRNPYQIGAELFGFKGAQADIEVLSLMLETLAICEVEDIWLDIGHIGIFRELTAFIGLNPDEQNKLADIIQRKASSELELFARNIDENQAHMLMALADMYGGSEVIAQARKVFDFPVIARILDEIEQFGHKISSIYPAQKVNYDLAELRGYKYHNGLLFAAYSREKGSPLALGGRYDDIGEVFGRSRPATGFSADLFELMFLSGKVWKKSAIFAPAVNDEKLVSKIKYLRDNGESVIMELPGQQGRAEDMGCDRVLRQNNGQWEIAGV